MINQGLLTEMLNMANLRLPLEVAKVYSNLSENVNVSNVAVIEELFRVDLSAAESERQRKLLKLAKQDLNQARKEILKDLSFNDVKFLVRSEEELARTEQFERLFPSLSRDHFLKYFKRDRYYNYLMDAWNWKYSSKKSDGIKLLNEKCNEQLFSNPIRP